MSDTQKSDALQKIQTGLREIGYLDHLIKSDYSFRDFLSSSSEPSVRQIEIAAFGQAPASLRSACFGITTPADDTPAAISPFRALGAPQILALHPKQGIGRRWRIGATGEPQLLEEISLGSIVSVFREHQAEWEPQRVLRAKTFAFADGPAQLDFCDIGLLPALEASLRPKLDHDLQNILTRCKDVYRQWHLQEPFEAVVEPLFRLVFRLIAAKMLIDRGDKPDWANLTAPVVLRNVEEFYFSGEQSEPILVDRYVQEAAWQQIRTGLDLQNLSVETLAFIYENTFVTQDIRRTQGTHATPQEIAEYIVRQLPIKSLDRASRIVFEPFTGAAPFLISALSLLRELLILDGSQELSEVERHNYFVQMLSGIENDPFAREIARYSLILADYPNRDGWRIEIQDAFHSPEFDRHLTQAKIVVSNPPYGSFTAEEQQALPVGASFLKEAEALRRVMLYPPAMLGFVLPRTFLDRREFRALRQAIVAYYQDVSIVVLPDKTFQKADAEVVLLIAHNHPRSGPRYHSGYVDKDDYSDFIHAGRLTWQDEHSSPLHKGNDVSLWRTPLQPIWDALAQYPRLGSFSEIHNGRKYKAGALNESIANTPAPDYKPGVQTLRGFVETFTVANFQYMSMKPELMSRPRSSLRWELPKVLVNTFRSSRGFWRIAGAIDDKGLIFSSQFYGMWPRSGTAVEILAAVISGPVANAYVSTLRHAKDNQIRLIQQIPVPHFTHEQTETIVSLVQDYQSYRSQWLAEPRRENFLRGKCLELLWQIDAEVLAAYDLPAELEWELLRKFEGAERRPLPFAFPGYGEGYENAKEALRQSKEEKARSQRYHTLVDKKYLEGLSVAENKEMEQLSQQMDAEEAPFYENILSVLQSSKQ